MIDREPEHARHPRKISLSLGRSDPTPKRKRGNRPTKEVTACARVAFLQAIEEAAQPVLIDLRDRVLPRLTTPEARKRLEAFARRKHGDPTSEQLVRAWVLRAASNIPEPFTWADTWGLTYNRKVPQWVWRQMASTLGSWIASPNSVSQGDLSWDGVLIDVPFEALWRRHGLRHELDRLSLAAVWNRRDGSISIEEVPPGGPSIPQDPSRTVICLPCLKALNLPPDAISWYPLLQSPEGTARRVGWDVAAAAVEYVMPKLETHAKPLELRYFPALRSQSVYEIRNRLEHELAVWIAKRLLPQLRKEIKEYETPKKDWDHFRWAVRYHCLREPLERAADYAQTRQAVHSAVRKVLELVKLTPRERRGRPPKSGK